VVEGMNKISAFPSSSSNHRGTDESVVTASTATATQTYSHSYSIDDGSTIISSDVCDSSSTASRGAYSSAFSHTTSNTKNNIAAHATIDTRSTAPVSPYRYHSFKAGNNIFTVDKRYDLIKVIGSGAYGVVISASDSASGSKSYDSNVAIKLVPRAFHDEIDAKRILREIKLLQHFHHENIISILDMMPPMVSQYVDDYNDVYIVTDLMETDLHKIIYSKQPLTIDHTQYFVYQILRALKYIHSANVLHRDLKPSNLLVNANCDLKVCDFGLARGIVPTQEDLIELDSDGDTQMMGLISSSPMLLTEYVVTRWYRAPEIMLACHMYSKPIDVWSVGCIMAELLGRKPYFPGNDYIDQVC